MSGGAGAALEARPQQAPLDRITCSDFTLDAGPTLQLGDVFRLKLNGEPGDGASWSYFRFRGHVLVETGAEYVSAYGGDDDPNGRRAWHAFDPTRVRTQGEFVRTSADEAARIERRRASK